MVGNIDLSEKHLRGHGFDPDVCNGCEHQGDGVTRACGLCGCPTTKMAPMDLLDAPPESCPYLHRHEDG